jgi:hypothetical protein
MQSIQPGTVSSLTAPKCGNNLPGFTGNSPNLQGGL